MTELHRLLKQARRRLGFTQAEMAEALSISLGTYSNYEQGKYPPPLKVYDRFVAMGVSAEWLRTGQGEMLTIQRALLGAEKSTTDDRFASSFVFELSTAEELAKRRNADPEFIRGLSEARQIFMRKKVEGEHATSASADSARGISRAGSMDGPPAKKKIGRRKRSK